MDDLRDAGVADATMQQLAGHADMRTTARDDRRGRGQKGGVEVVPWPPPDDRPGEEATMTSRDPVALRSDRCPPYFPARRRAARGCGSARRERGAVQYQLRRLARQATSAWWPAGSSL